ncbi:peptidoglycan-binding domain-containing protein [Psychromonas antarctica]|uniref:peptidoglycan-binding domain-containing protein n=1 Tax=Psychromonas antarctica TaxID=67573 RepID=UPI001EE879CD|nr:peptidoglycan-binding domain-containing protein [Psychromonas antarctica]MCG6201070.1 peptidoglycan-binding protein [Psychromonas antarctica]
MHLSIDRSVGNKGLNQYADVKLIQTLLNCYYSKFSPIKPLQLDGRCGVVTINAILSFQRDVIKLMNPDGRVDPNGATFRALTKNYKVIDQEKIAAHQKNYMTWDKLIHSIFPIVNSPLIYRIDNLSDYQVTYKSNIKASAKIVSEYSKKVIKMALKDSGMPHAVITSTIRTPKEQASIMYRNAKINYQKQFDLYGFVGEEVLKVYKKNSTSEKSTVIDLMTAKIEEYLKNNKRTSKHCVTPEVYKTLNIIDIGLNSTRTASGKEFNQDKFTKALTFLVKNGYIEKFIDETKKSNVCWHIEIIPNKKTIQ